MYQLAASAIRAISFALILYTLTVEACLIYCVLSQNKQFESITIFGLIGCIVLSLIASFCFKLANRLDNTELKALKRVVELLNDPFGVD